MNPNKILGITFVLFAVLFLLMGIGMLWGLSLVSGTISAMAMIAPGASGIASMLSMLWIVAILEVLAGIFSLISAILLFTTKE